MKDELLVSELQANGHVTGDQLAVWNQVARLCAVLDAIGREGCNAVVKIDGGRVDGAVYTVVVSGGRLGEAFFRKDGADVGTLLREAIAFYSSRVWSA